MKLTQALGALLAIAGLQVIANPVQEHGQNTGSFVERDLASTILHEIEGAATCAGCEAILIALQGLANLGDHFFVSVLTEICILAKATDADVCTGSLAAEGPILAHDLRELSVGSHTSQLLCITLLGLCPYPDVRPYTIAFPTPKPLKARPAPSGKTPIDVVHISDTHVDLAYETGANYNCTKPICCRSYTPADSPGNNSYPAGPFGNSKCDPPLSLEQSMFAAIEKLDPEPAFTIFTGDVAAHDVWLVNQNEVTQDLNTTYSNMLGLKLVYPVVGNHDTAPVNAYPPAALAGSANPQWSYDTLATDWTPWIGASAAAEADQYGAYSVLYPGGKLRIISFNSVFYYIQDYWMYEDPMEYDPSGQFAWLVKELQAAETAGERVWLISHVPTGSPDFFHDYSAYFDQIVQRYDATIAALFYGHTHLDQFQLAYSDYSAPTFDTAVATSYIAPSMTPTSGSPSFRVYSVDPETFGILDFTEYITNISAPTFQTNPMWEKYYSAKETYGALLTPPLTDPSAELTPAFWHNVTEIFQSNDSAFQDYHARKSRGFKADIPCTADCKALEICGLRAARSQFNCVVPRPGIHFSKRDEGGSAQSEAGECEGSMLRVIFAKMMLG